MYKVVCYILAFLFVMLCSDLLGSILQHVIHHGRDIIFHRLKHVLRHHPSLNLDCIPRPVVFVWHHYERYRFISFERSLVVRIIVDWGDHTVSFSNDMTKLSISHVYDDACAEQEPSHVVRMYPLPLRRGQVALPALTHLGGKENGGNGTPVSKYISFGNIGITSLHALCMCSNRNVEFEDRIDTSQITDMSYMFAGAGFFNRNLHHWDVSNVVDMSGMFMRATQFNGSIGAWNTQSVTNMCSMFTSSFNFNQPIGSWNTSNVTNMSGMFEGAKSFNQPLESWDVHNVTNMWSMFSYATSFDQPLEKWNTSNVTLMLGMFKGASSFNQSLSGWDVSNVQFSVNMFKEATSFTHAHPNFVRASDDPPCVVS